MRHSTVLIALLIWGVIPTAQAQFEEAFEVCSIEIDSEERLACYDRFAASFEVPGSMFAVAIEESILPYAPEGLSSDGPNYLGISNAQKFSARGDRGEHPPARHHPGDACDWRRPGAGAGLLRLHADGQSRLADAPCIRHL